MNGNETFADPMDEIYAIRRRISAKYCHDVHRIAEAARERMIRDEAMGKRKYVRLPIARVCKPFEYPSFPEGQNVPCACEP